jgi:small subunit ribosomal protein S18e
MIFLQDPLVSLKYLNLIRVPTDYNIPKWFLNR